MAKPTSDRLKLFISYSRRDMAVTDQLVERLEAAGFEATIDRRDLPYGEEWQAELADFIRAADTIVWLVSPASVASKWCNWELGEVQRLNKRLVPVMIEGVPPEDLPESLGKIHVLPAEGIFDADTHLDTLVTALNTDRTWLKEHTRLGDRARQWHAKGERGDLLLRGSALNDAESWRDKQPKAAPQPSDDILDLILASRRAHGRRQRITVAGSLAVALVAIALSGVALWQRNEAQVNEARAVEQEEIAEERAVEAEAARQQAQDALDQATETANGIVFDLAQRFRDLSVPNSVILEILNEALTLQAELFEHAAGKPELLASRAGAMAEAARTLEAVGEIETALQAMAGALQSQYEMVAQGRRDTELLRSLADTLTQLGALQFHRGDADAANASYALALAVLSLANSDADAQADAQADPAAGISLARQLDELRTRIGGLTASAETLSSLVINLRAELDAAPDDAARRGELYRNLVWLGDVQFRENRLEDAIESYRESAAIARDFVASSPDDTSWKLSLATALSKIGRVSMYIIGAQEAVNRYTEADAVYQDMLRTDRGNLSWWTRYAENLLAIATVLTLSKQYDDALAISVRAYGMCEHVRGQRPDNPEFLYLCIQASFARASNLISMERLDEAAEPMAESLRISRQLLARDPEDRLWQRSVATTLSRSADLERALGDLTTADAMVTEAVSLFEAIALAEPENPQALVNLLAAVKQAWTFASDDRKPDLVAQAQPIVERLRNDYTLNPSQTRATANLSETLGLGEETDAR